MKVVVTKQSPEYQFDFTGGQLAVDFANTVSWRDHPRHRNDHLESYLDVVAFAKQSKVVDAKQAQELSAYASNHVAESRRIYLRAVGLREAVYRTFAHIARGQGVDARDLAIITDETTAALRRRVLAPHDGGYAWQWTTEATKPLERPLWPITQAAAELLTSAELRTVRICEAEDCGWLFLDHSRNRSRRWCDMTTCGNRAKARRHYRRVRE